MEARSNHSRPVWRALTLVALVLSLLALALQANQFWLGRKREEVLYTTSFHFEGVFLRFDTDWNRKSVSENVLELTSPEDDIKISIAVFDGHESPLKMSEEELLSASSSFLAHISERAIRSNNAHRWPFYLASRTKQVDGRYYAQYRIVVFLPGRKVMIEATTPNKILEHDPSASNPFGTYPHIVGTFVDSITIVEEISQDQQ